jgi:hypothetical protein
MNVESGNEDAQFPEKEHRNGIFVAVRIKITTHSSPYALFNVHIFEPLICGASVYFYEAPKYREISNNNNNNDYFPQTGNYSFSFISMSTPIKIRRDTANFELYENI